MLSFIKQGKFMARRINNVGNNAMRYDRDAYIRGHLRFGKQRFDWRVYTVAVDKPVRTPEEALVLMTLCHMAGMSVVWNKDTRVATLFGTVIGMSLLEWPYPKMYSRSRGWYANSPNTPLHLNHKLAEVYQRSGPEVYAQRAQRVQLVAQWHAIALHSKKLRLRGAQARTGYEVTLQHRAGPLYLGGVVWRPTYYLSGQARRDMKARAVIDDYYPAGTRWPLDSTIQEIY
jgi:hypothetical protein